MSVWGSKITETKKNMRLLKRVYLFPIFFSSENALICLIYWFFLRKKTIKPAELVDWRRFCDAILLPFKEDLTRGCKFKLCASARDSSNFAILFIIYTPKFIHWKGAKLISIHKPVEKAESQSNGAYHTFHVWEKRYVQSGTTYHQRYAFETVRKVIIQNPLAGMFISSHHSSLLFKNMRKVTKRMAM